MENKQFIIFLTILILILPSPICHSSANLKKLSNSKILYVGGSGLYNYSSIQKAINDAGDGDTIYVYNGTYYENIIIDKSISLIGEDCGKTVINTRGIGDCVFINACNVKISGFTIENTSGRGVFIQSIFHNGENISISSNIIRDTYYGIEFYHSRNNLISGNEIYNNFLGVHLDATDSTVIRKNNISNNKNGIILYFSSGKSGNKIYKNDIKNNYQGIIIAKAWFRIDKIYSNNFVNNTVFNAFFLNCKSRWYGNYWDDKKDFLPFYFIIGNYSIVRFSKIWSWWLQIDWHPADEPYLI